MIMQTLMLNEMLTAQKKRQLFNVALAERLLSWQCAHWSVAWANGAVCQHSHRRTAFDDWAAPSLSISVSHYLSVYWGFLLPWCVLECVLPLACLCIRWHVRVQYQRCFACWLFLPRYHAQQPHHSTLLSHRTQPKRLAEFVYSRLDK